MTTSECKTCLGLDAGCDDCGPQPRPDGVEVWKNGGEGECAGCGRRVRNTFTKGRGKACVQCLWGAWANS